MPPARRIRHAPDVRNSGWRADTPRRCTARPAGRPRSPELRPTAGLRGIRPTGRRNFRATRRSRAASARRVTPKFLQTRREAGRKRAGAPTAGPPPRDAA